MLKEIKPKTKEEIVDEEFRNRLVLDYGYRSEWISGCKSGYISGRPDSNRTIEIKEYYSDYFWRKAKALLNKETNFTISDIRQVLFSLPPHYYSTKKKTYDSLASLAKYLILIGVLDPSFKEEFKSLKPRRLEQPYRPVAREEEVKKLLKGVEESVRYSKFDKLRMRLIIILIFATGTRREEATNIELDHIDLNRRELLIPRGKGSKARRLGINKEVYKAFVQYLKLKPKSRHNYLLVLNDGTKLSKKSLSQQFYRLSKRCGLNLTLHSLRRGMASKYGNSGVPIQHLKTILGHSSVITTEKSYFFSDENLVVQNMKNWR